MFNLNHAVRNAFITGAAFFSILIVSGEPRAQATDCVTALGSTTGYTSLSNAATTSKEKGVDEWDGEILRIQTVLPGVLTLEGVGTASQTSLYSNDGSGPEMLDSAELGDSLGDLNVVVPAGYHCVEVAPPPSSTGDFEVQATFTDVCHLGDVDDHGDSFICATSVTVGGSSASGEITSSNTTNDVDMFKFVLSSSATVTITSTGSTDVQGNLYDADGMLLDSDDDSGTGSNFEITQSLAAGTYYVQVKGSDGSYGLSITQ